MEELTPKTTPDKFLSIVARRNDQLEITWHGVATYTVTNGMHIAVSREEDCHPELMLQPFYSIVPAAVLLQKRFFVIHGNAIAIDGQAIIIAGEKGLGKSTITAALLSNNHRIIADDVTAINTGTTPPEVLPGIPNLKVWPDAAKAVGIKLSSLKKINPFIDKYNYHLPHHFRDKNTPLRAIIFLNHGEKPAIEQIPKNQSTLWLLKNSYFSRYPQALSKQEHIRSLEGCSYLAKNINIFKLSYPRNLDMLQNLTSLIENL